MCPSYRVTHEEEHSTRGRGRLLWEMMKGEVIKDGWKSKEVKAALDLCLACKGWKGASPDVTYTLDCAHAYRSLRRRVNARTTVNEAKPAVLE